MKETADVKVVCWYCGWTVIIPNCPVTVDFLPVRYRICGVCKLKGGEDEKAQK